MLKDGVIVERGRHETLLLEQGMYADMWNQQLQNLDAESNGNGLSMETNDSKKEKHGASGGQGHGHGHHF